MKKDKAPKCEATKAGMIPPDDPEKFGEWRKSLDPDAMGFDGPVEGGVDNDS